MSISVNGQSVVPPGFRFHPTEEELLTYYLAKRAASRRIDLDVITDVDLNKLEPWDIQERCRIGTGPQNDWYLFSHKDKKYPSGTRTNRATAAGFWKATGRDKAIYSAAVSGRIGMRKTLVFYKGRAPHGHKSDWIMHEYRLDDAVAPAGNPASAAGDGSAFYSGASASPSAPIRGVAGNQWLPAQEDGGWVICRVFKKKNVVVQHQAGQSTGCGGGATKLTGAAAMARRKSNCSSTVTNDSDHTKADQMQQETKPTNPSSSSLDHLINSACQNGSSTLYEKFMKLPPLEHVIPGGLLPPVTECQGEWDALDQLAAYELNCLSDAPSAKTMHGMSSVDELSGDTLHASSFTSASDGDLWSLARSVSSLHADLTISCFKTVGC